MAAKKAKKKTAKKTAAKPVKRRSSALEGEGSYIAARNYDKRTEAFLAKNKGKVTKLARDAERALEGPEGKSLRAAEKKGKAKARR